MLKNSIITFLISLISIQGFSQKLNEELIYSEKMSSRAIFIDENKIWFGMNKGRFGYYDTKLDTTLIFSSSYISDQTEIRSIAGNEESVFLLPVGNPASLVKVNKATLKEELVYSEENEKVFYDSMQFGKNGLGFAMGDPTDLCLSVLKTENNGNTWEKLSCTELPSVFDGEAAFAASNTNLKIIDSKIILVSGGKKSRVFISEDKGNKFEVFETPIIQGEAMTGIFSMDFYDKNLGIIGGGNYEKPEENKGNLAITKDGGKTWKLIAEGKGPGYISCIQFIPNSNGKKLIAAGATGIFISKNSGKTWEKISEKKDTFSLKFMDENTFYAVGRELIKYSIFNK
ncbi:MAG: hypothetical protein RIR51_1533 [Bacteroidota bacterium]